MSHSSDKWISFDKWKRIIVRHLSPKSQMYRLFRCCADLNVVQMCLRSEVTDEQSIRFTVQLVWMKNWEFVCALVVALDIFGTGMQPRAQQDWLSQIISQTLMFLLISYCSQLIHQSITNSALNLIVIKL